jgi:hypothetical protein
MQNPVPGKGVSHALGTGWLWFDFFCKTLKTRSEMWGLTESNNTLAYLFANSRLTLTEKIYGISTCIQSHGSAFQKTSIDSSHLVEDDANDSADDHCNGLPINVYGVRKCFNFSIIKIDHVRFVNGANEHWPWPNQRYWLKKKSVPFLEIQQRTIIKYRRFTDHKSRHSKQIHVIVW